MVNKNLTVFLKGFTLIEALIVIAIIGLMSVFYVVNLRPDTTELLKMDTTRLAADIRYVRSLATSRVTYNGVFPVGGYGIVFYNRDGSSKSFYQLYASSYGNPANIIKTVELSDSSFHLLDPNSSTYISDINANDTRSFYFESENSISTNGFQMSTDGDYQIEIYSYDTRSEEYSRGIINIGRQTADYFVWSNLAVTYDIGKSVCGNRVKEVGEDCEREDLDGNVDSSCTTLCKFNICGDGYITGGEECERNNLPTRVGLSCSFYWCYSCASLAPYVAEGSTLGGCSIVTPGGDVIENQSCCGGSDNLRDSWECINCKKSQTTSCLQTCPVGDPADQLGF